MLKNPSVSDGKNRWSAEGKYVPEIILGREDRYQSASDSKPCSGGLVMNWKRKFSADSLLATQNG